MVKDQLLTRDPAPHPPSGARQNGGLCGFRGKGRRAALHLWPAKIFRGMMHVMDAVPSVPELPGAAAARLDPLPPLRAHERELRERFHVRSLALFGSSARGQAGPASDVDLLVEFDRPIGLLHLSATALRLEGVLQRPVDLVLRRALRPELRGSVLAEAVNVF